MRAINVNRKLREKVCQSYEVNGKLWVIKFKNGECILFELYGKWIIKIYRKILQKKKLSILRLKFIVIAFRNQIY